MRHVARYITVVFVGLAAAALLAGPAAARTRLTLHAPAGAYPQIGAAVDTAARASGGGYEIRIGGNCLANQQGCRTRHLRYGSQPVQLVVLKRTTLATVATQPLSAGLSGARAALAAAKKYAGGSDLVVLASLPGHATSGGYSLAISVITGSPSAGQVNSSGGWAAIGVPTVPAHAVTGVLNQGFVADRGHPPGDLRGYFQLLQVQPSIYRYSFVSGRYLSYNTHAAGSGGGTDVMRIGAWTYTLKLPNQSQCTGGYAIVVLDAVNLAPLSKNAYATNCTSGGTDSAGWTAVNARLAHAASIQQALVFVQSIGNPANPGCLCSVFGSSSGAALQTLGASAETWNRSLYAGGYKTVHGNSGYAMVGSPAIVADALPVASPDQYAPEAVSTITGQAARLQGMLRGDFDSNYLPVTGAAVPTPLGPSIATAEYAPSQAWTTPTTPGQQKVLSWISNGAKGSRLQFSALRYSPGSSCYEPKVPDVRFEFCDTARTYSDVGRAITPAAPPAACGCTQRAWDAVTRDLSLEISRRNKVLGYLSKLSTVYGSGLACSNAQIDLRTITTKINDKLQVKKGLIEGGRWDSLLSDGFNVLSSIFYTAFPDGSVVANVLNNVSAVGYLAGDGLTAAESPNALISRVSVEASQLGPTLQKVFCTAQFGLGQAEASIFSDAGKLKAAASSAAFQIDQTTLNKITPTLNLGAERFIYSHLLGAVYQPYTLLQSDLDTYNFHTQVRTPLTFACNVLDTAFYPWKKAPTSTWIQLSPRDPVYPGTLSGPIGMALSTPFHYSFFNVADYVRSPPVSVMTTLTNPIAKGGLGMSLFDLFFHHFKRSAVLCLNGSHVSGPSHTYGPSNLNWP